MTNSQIILEAMINAELDPEVVTVDTFAGWKRKGYQVRKGESAAFKTKIWKPAKKRNEVDVENPEYFRSMYLVNASFFTSEQVERIESDAE